MKNRNKIALSLCGVATALTALTLSIYGYVSSVDKEKEAIIKYMNSESYKTTCTLTEEEIKNKEQEIADLGAKVNNGEADLQELINANKEYEEIKTYYNSTQYVMDNFKSSEEYTTYKQSETIKLISGACWTASAIFSASANNSVSNAIFGKKDEENN